MKGDSVSASVEEGEIVSEEEENTAESELQLSGSPEYRPNSPPSPDPPAAGGGGKKRPRDAGDDCHLCDSSRLTSSSTYKPRVLSADAPELPVTETANPVGLPRADMVDGQAGGMDMEQLRRVALLSMMR